MAKKQADKPVPEAVAVEPAPMKAPTRLVRRPDMATYYASSTGVIMTNYDLSLIFGKMEQGSDDKLFVDQFAKVTMSYHHAKVLADMLTKTIEKYEAENGVLGVKGEVMRGSI
jgi:hypothetical protein